MTEKQEPHPGPLYVGDHLSLVGAPKWLGRVIGRSKRGLHVETMRNVFGDPMTDPMTYRDHYRHEDVPKIFRLTWPGALRRVVEDPRRRHLYLRNLGEARAGVLLVEERVSSICLSIALCNPGDEWDTEHGLQLALTRMAEGTTGFVEIHKKIRPAINHTLLFCLARDVGYPEKDLYTLCDSRVVRFFGKMARAGRKNRR